MELLQRIGVLTLIFVSGWVEDRLLQRRDIPCATWMIGLGALVAWIAYPMTLLRVVVALVILATGLWALRSYWVLSRWNRATTK
jgi:hypothetical protein